MRMKCTFFSLKYAINIPVSSSDTTGLCSGSALLVSSFESLESLATSAEDWLFMAGSNCSYKLRLVSPARAFLGCRCLHHIRPMVIYSKQQVTDFRRNWSWRLLALDRISRQKGWKSMTCARMWKIAGKAIEVNEVHIYTADTFCTKSKESNQ